MKFQVLLLTVVACLCLNYVESHPNNGHPHGPKPGHPHGPNGHGPIGGRSRLDLQIRSVDDAVEETIELRAPRTTLINSLIQAADQDNQFNFAADYTGDDGFIITELRGLANDADNQWVVLLDPDTPVTERLEEYIPPRGSTVIFDYVPKGEGGAAGAGGG